MNPLSKNNDWQATNADLLQKSNTRAWNIAIIASLACVVTLTAYFLKPAQVITQPYVVRMDNTTGKTDLIQVMKDQYIDENEAVRNHQLSEYVKARERYNWYTIQDDYDFIGLMSSETVGAEYAANYAGEKSIDKVYEDKIEIRVSIISVVAGESTGTVRYSTTKKHKTITETSTFVATISYAFLNTKRMSSEDKLINHLGFQVTAYRVDKEINQDT